MAVHVTLVHGHPHGLRHLQRALQKVLGAVLAVVAVAASLIAVPASLALLVGGLLGTHSSGSEIKESLNIPWDQLGPVAGQTMLITIVAGLLGAYFLRGKRRLVLFLRRFGYDEATKAVTLAAATSMGTTWRLVTLDDAEVAPLGLTTPTRLAYRAGQFGSEGVRRLIVRPLSLVVKAMPYAFGAAAVIPFIDMFSRPNPDKLAILNEYVQIVAKFTGDRTLPAIAFDLRLAFLVAAADVLAGLTILIVGFVLVFAMIPLFGPYVAYSTITQGLARAERDKRFTIGGAGAISMVVRMIAYESKGFFAPRLVVVKVASSSWRDTVRAFAGVSAAALIDISEPTESLLWEIDHLETIAAKTVLVGDYERVASLATTAGEASGSITERLAALIDGRDVLAYRDEEDSMQRFARELSDALETAAG